MKLKKEIQEDLLNRPLNLNIEEMPSTMLEGMTLAFEILAEINSYLAQSPVAKVLAKAEQQNARKRGEPMLVIPFSDGIELDSIKEISSKPSPKIKKPTTKKSSTVKTQKQKKPSEFDVLLKEAKSKGIDVSDIKDIKSLKERISVMEDLESSEMPQPKRNPSRLFQLAELAMEKDLDKIENLVTQKHRLGEKR